MIESDVHTVMVSRNDAMRQQRNESCFDLTIYYWKLVRLNLITDFFEVIKLKAAFDDISEY